MKKIWKYLSNHLKEDFHIGQYLSIAAILTIALSINYTISFEKGFLDKQTGLLKVFYFFLTYAAGYYIVLLTYTFYEGERDFWRNRLFWIKSLLALLVLSLDCSMPYLKDLIKILFHPQLWLWTKKIANNLISFFLILGPLLLFYRLREKHEGHYYGLSAKGFDMKPYIIMLLIMLPLIALASLNSGFLKQYPMYRHSDAHVYLGVSEWVTAGLYEVCYALNFVTLEFLFRGFMVIGMINVLGRKAILPMIAVYCFIHFGKPAGEAISSIFGGYILGVIALETQSIWGGIIVHVGIALMMELAAFISKSL